MKYIVWRFIFVVICTVTMTAQKRRYLAIHTSANGHLNIYTRIESTLFFNLKLLLGVILFLQSLQTSSKNTSITHLLSFSHFDLSVIFVPVISTSNVTLSVQIFSESFALEDLERLRTLCPDTNIHNSDGSYALSTLNWTLHVQYYHALFRICTVLLIVKGRYCAITLIV